MFLWLQPTLTQNRFLSVRDCCFIWVALAAVATESVVAFCPSPSISLKHHSLRSCLTATLSTAFCDLLSQPFTKHRSPQTRWRDVDAEVVERCCCRQSTTFSSSFRLAQRSRYGCLNSSASVLREPSEFVILSFCSNHAHTDYLYRVSMSS